MSLLRLRIWWKRRRMTPEQRDALDKHLAMATIRSELAFWGHDVSDMTDEQLELGAVELSRLIASAGVPAAVVAESFRRATS